MWEGRRRAMRRGLWSPAAKRRRVEMQLPDKENAKGVPVGVHGEWKTGTKDVCEGERLHP